MKHRKKYYPRCCGTTMEFVQENKVGSNNYKCPKCGFRI